MHCGRVAALNFQSRGYVLQHTVLVTGLFGLLCCCIDVLFEALLFPKFAVKTFTIADLKFILEYINSS